MKDLIEQVLEIEAKAGKIVAKAEAESLKVAEAGRDEARKLVEAAREEAAAKSHQIVEDETVKAQAQRDARVEQARADAKKIADIDPAALSRAIEIIVAAILGRKQQA